MEDFIKKMYEVEKLSDLDPIVKFALRDMRYSEKLNEEDLKRYKYILLNCIEDEEVRPDFTECEEAYRRGFHQGFYTARHSDTEEEKVAKWRYSNDLVGPPGSFLDGIQMEGLTEKDEDKFFMKGLKQMQGSQK